jgi:hypothetical protein
MQDYSGPNHAKFTQVFSVTMADLMLALPSAPKGSALPRFANTTSAPLAEFLTFQYFLFAEMEPNNGPQSPSERIHHDPRHAIYR